MITYNDIYEALRKEKYSEALQPLNKKFVSEVAEYLEERKQAAVKEGDLFSDSVVKTKKQLENAISMFKELLMRRKKKLLNLSFIAKETGISKKDFENMLGSEKEMFDKIIKSMEESDSQIEELIRGKSEKQSMNQLISFKTNVEEFLDMSGEKVGPFEKGELANLPEEIVKILIDSEKAEMVDN